MLFVACVQRGCVVLSLARSASVWPGPLCGPVCVEDFTSLVADLVSFRSLGPLARQCFGCSGQCGWCLPRGRFRTHFLLSGRGPRAVHCAVCAAVVSGLVVRQRVRNTSLFVVVSVGRALCLFLTIEEDRLRVACFYMIFIRVGMGSALLRDAIAEDLFFRRPWTIILLTPNCHPKLPEDVRARRPCTVLCLCAILASGLVVRLF